ncbi:MAG: response regulator transcription factor [Actinomycetota bacterium]|nr:response regulator transcription factor [Actinomycetota bacterium]
MPLVCLIDDHQLFSASLAVALRTEGFDVHTPQLTSLESVRQTVVLRHPEVVILDRDLAALGNGEELLPPLTRAGCPVMIVSATLDDVVIGRCLAAGAVACLQKNEPFGVLLATIASVTRGEAPMPEAERYRLIDAWRRWQSSADVIAGAFAQLTPREASVLGQLMDGRSVRAIAKTCFVSEATVRTHVRGILTKLEVASQLEAVVLAVQSGWHPDGAGGPGTSHAAGVAART